MEVRHTVMFLIFSGAVERDPYIKNALPNSCGTGLDNGLLFHMSWYRFCTDISVWKWGGGQFPVLCMRTVVHKMQSSMPK